MSFAYQAKSTVCPPDAGSYTLDQNLDQKFKCCAEDELGFKYIVTTNSRDECLARFGGGGGSGGTYSYEECIPGIPIGCGMLTVVAIGVVGAIGTMLAALYVRRR